MCNILLYDSSIWIENLFVNLITCTSSTEKFVMYQFIHTLKEVSLLPFRALCLMRSTCPFSPLSSFCPCPITWGQRSMSSSLIHLYHSSQPLCITDPSPNSGQLRKTYFSHGLRQIIHLSDTKKLFYDPSQRNFTLNETNKRPINTSE